MALIYVVEDDEPIRRELVDILARAGFEIEACESFEHVSRDILAAAPDLVLLDLTLPVKDGQHICHEVRRESEVPIIVLTSRTTEIDEVMAMTLGADDFVSKPFSMLELIARIRAVLRRAEPVQTSGDFSLGLLFVSPDRHEVKVGGKDVTLTNKEFELLCLLLRNKGIVLTRATLMDRVWGFESERENRTLDVHIRTLRVKLGEAGSYIETVRGIGYKIGGDGV